MERRALPSTRETGFRALARTLAGMAAVAGLAMGSAALAESNTASRTMAVSGSTPEICALQPGAVQTGSLVNMTGLDGDTLRVAQFADPTTLAVRAANATLSISAVCNFPHKVRVQSENNGMWPGDGRQALDAHGFTSAVPYQARVTWNGASNTLETDARVRHQVEDELSVNMPAAGSVELHVEIAPGASNSQANAPLLAGTYTDTLRIFLEPL
ncbi:MAG TPA: hypothetical protein VFP14_11285 [Novosphingobium sp.]|nr:hypothetical protein [Novosphingobium sp.]